MLYSNYYGEIGITIFFLMKLTVICVGHNSNFSIVKKGFKHLRLNGTFVDKSLLINEILNRDEKVFQITRPMKWGKTINLDMIKTFFEVELNENGEIISDENKVNQLLFKGGEFKTAHGRKYLLPLKVSEVDTAMKHIGRYPVVTVNLDKVGGDSIPEIEKSLQKLVAELFAEYPFIKKYMDNSSDLFDDNEKARLSNFVRGNLEEEYLFDALEFLSMVLYEHFNCYVCLFIDNYDLPLVKAYLNFGSRGKEFEYVVEVFKRIYDYTFKENQYLFKAIITGTLNLEIVPSGKDEFEYNYILYNSVLDQEFFKFYGVTEEELNVLKLCNDTINLMNYQKWYGGFFLNGVEMYNFGSVIETALCKGSSGYYILGSTNKYLFNFILDAFLTENIQDSLHLLSTGKEIIREQFIKSFRLKQIGNDIFSMLVQVGFLTVKPPKRVTENPIWRMKIPNFDIRGVFASVFKHLAAKELGVSVKEYNDFTKLLFTNRIQHFGDRLQTFLQNQLSFNTSNRDEHLYHNLMCNIAASLGVGYVVDSIKEHGLNRGEHLMIPLEGFGDFAIIMEYTVCTPWQPLEQFVQASLEDMLHRPVHCTYKIRSCQHVSKVLYIAIGFCGQKVFIKHNIVKLT